MRDNAVDELMAGAIDGHIHSKPDVIPRRLSDVEVARAARRERLAAVVLKCHVMGTAARAAIAQECVADVRVFGGLALNRPVGGLNPAAAETEIALGAKEIWLPTISAANHLRFRGGDPGEAVPVVDDRGRLLPAVHDILALVAKAGIILGTGHVSVDECRQIAAAAKAAGVERVLVTHPEFEITAMPVAVQQELAALGNVFFERCFFATNSPQKLPAAEVARQIKAVGAATTVLSSDFGQMYNEDPGSGFRRFIAAMLDHGVTATEIAQMVKKNPRYLLAVPD